MHTQVHAQEDIGVQDGIDLLRAYSEISDPLVRKKVLAWVLDACAGATRWPDQGSPRLADESGAEV